MSPYSGWFDPIKVGTNIAKLLCVTGLSIYNIYISPIFWWLLYPHVPYPSSCVIVTNC